MKFFKELRSLDRSEWGNIFTAIFIAAIVDIALWALGLLISFGDGGTPAHYWAGATVLGTIMTAALIGGGAWGSLDARRMRNQPQHRTSTVPKAQLLPHPR